MTNFPRPVLSALFALLLLTACDPLASTAGPGAASPTTTVSTSGASGSALAAVSTLSVKGRGPRTGYARAKFGPAWQDVDHNGCDTRNDILGRDLTGTVFRVGTHGCVVTRGSLQEPYTGRTVAFVRGPRSSAVQIDHVVALSDAWQKGAAQWPAATRLAFANDPLNLLAVDGPANMAKGDGDLAATEQVLPVRLHGPAGGGEGQVPPERDHRRAGGPDPGAQHLPRTDPAALTGSATCSRLTRSASSPLRAASGAAMMTQRRAGLSTVPSAGRQPCRDCGTVWP